MTELCAIALGSNLSSTIGDPEKIVQAAIAQLSTLPEIEVVRVSRWYRTKAIVLPNADPQPDYINGCAVLRTSLPPLQLLQALFYTEQIFGRERRERWGARTLDLDLLLYGDRVLDKPELVLPHPRMGDRAFVLLPLAEIAADWIHPIYQMPISELAKNPPDIDLSHPIAIDTEVLALS
ncbi:MULTISPECIES: 2-amino-4-hydroxy-6-hydroxymethyldihydropteridine diphosphokinase [Pseudanabaena]|uniref:2-amino-4-hydroxy-6-hydroxymethyldihydropteridine diphosphokinase n=2 Tax=Pseudanabaena TaxID=1152 RepID=L8MZE6_9CYAN|nr:MULTISPECIES: 2-amino-4-hydroxy-6-hydroxymethyldihydropteridine diphosphokinase [Pseudanabaena]ELS32169.1 2-amino-4-hydroxy-6- hydroxymethyldihydropteridine pyrophosphokinase [Pseudanabaena biceps PCC 7429]MDG3495571.1 2-amino-4-hydroxy-6-hydroxymethyldihydropteridine diphosphokinase [Pseudanabaena catenata USMAC16]